MDNDIIGYEEYDVPTKDESGNILYTEHVKVPIYNEFRKEKDSLEAGIELYKSKLEETDYQAIKFSEGEILPSEYAPIREQRRAWRIKINELEEKLKNI